jgi:hypothetical protein
MSTNKNISTTEKTYEATVTCETPDYIVHTAQNTPNIDEVTELAKGSYYAVRDMIAECWDDGYSAIIASGIGANLTATVITENPSIVDGNEITIKVRDDGPGIADINGFMTYGCKRNQQTALNACGCGPKNIPATKMTVRTTHNGRSFIIDSFAIGAKYHEMKQVFTDLPHGTEFNFTIDAKYLRNEIYRHDGKQGAPVTDVFSLLCEYLEENLGFIFAGTMLNNPHITLQLTSEEHIGKHVHTDTVVIEPVYPMFNMNTQSEDDVPYYHEKTTMDAFNKKPGEIDVHCCCGRAVPNRPSKLGYCGKSSATQYWTIRVMGRAVGYTDDLAGCKQKHPDMNGVMGVVDMYAPTAAYLPKMETSKTGFKKEDEKVLHKRIFDLVPGLTHKLNELVGPNEHTMLCNNIVNALIPAGTHDYQKRIFREHNVGSTVKAIIDIIDFEHQRGYEIKPTKAGLSALLQARCYLEEMAVNNDPCLNQIKTVWLCAPSFVKGLQEKTDEYNADFNRSRRYRGCKIKLVDIRDVPGANFAEVHQLFSRKK